MNNALPFLLRHGYAVLFVMVFAEQAGLPGPPRGRVPSLVSSLRHRRRPTAPSSAAKYKDPPTTVRLRGAEL